MSIVSRKSLQFQTLLDEPVKANLEHIAKDVSTFFEAEKEAGRMITSVTVGRSFVNEDGRVVLEPKPLPKRRQVPGRQYKVVPLFELNQNDVDPEMAYNPMLYAICYQNQIANKLHSEYPDLVTEFTGCEHTLGYDVVNQQVNLRIEYESKTS